MPILCSVIDCDGPHYGRGFCRAHWRRWSRHGDPLAGAARNHEPLASRLQRGLPADLNPAKCWPWQRGHSRGYGVVTLPDGGSTKAHVVSYELAKGPIPAGLELDHTCRNRGCVNPEHLEPVTRAENVRRGWPFRADYRGGALCRS